MPAWATPDPVDNPGKKWYNHDSKKLSLSLVFKGPSPYRQEARPRKRGVCMQKYAIFRSETGYYYYRYYDTVESLAGTMFEGIIGADSLPVVIDDTGGFFSLSGAKYQFVKLAESDTCPLTLEEMYFKNSDNFKLGWMSPEGDTYACSYTGHEKCSKMLAEKFFPGAKLPERTLGKAGWIKIIDSWDGTQREHKQFVYSLTGKITKRQADKLFDLGLYANPEVLELLSASEDSW